MAAGRWPQTISDNPFCYGGIVEGESFADREAELAELLADMRAGQNVLIISPRRFGKTSLLFRAASLLRSDGGLVAYVDLFRTQTKERLAAKLAEAINDGLLRPWERAWEKASAFFGNLPLAPQVTMSQDGSVAMSFGAATREVDLDATIERLLAVPAKIAASRQFRVAVILDEFQQVAEIDSALLGLMRSVFQEQRQVSHVFAGSRRHLLETVFTGRNQPMYRMAKRVPLGPIPRTDFGAFIRERFGRAGRIVADAALDRIFAIAGCHPHDTQELCHFLWIASAGGSGPIGPDLVDAAVKRVLAAEDSRFDDLWTFLPAGQRRLLAALAEGASGPMSEAFRRLHGLGAASTVQHSLKRLMEADLVAKEQGGRYRLVDPFLAFWLRESQN